MHLREYPDRDGRMVWLDQDEVDLLLSVPDDTSVQVAFKLGVRCGLRSQEIVQVRPKDVVATSAGPRVRVEVGKGGKYRETPAPIDVYHTTKSAVDFGGIDPEDELVPKTTRTIRRWVSSAGEYLAERTGDPGWSYLRPHDLRRTWATALAAGAEVDPLLVCEWGGWDDLDTFLDHYLGVYSPQVQRRELEKVDWLDAESAVNVDRDPETRLLNHADVLAGYGDPSSPVKPRG